MVDVPTLGKASVVTFAPQGASAKVPGATLGIGWGVHEGQLHLTAGPAPALLLGTDATSSTHLGDTPRSAKAIAALGDWATFALFARPMALEATRGGTEGAAAPATVAMGRRGDDAWARIEVADVLLRELLHLQAGL